MSSRSSSGGYTLVICEKPDAARKVADALSSTSPEVFKVAGVPVFKLEDVRGRAYVVCAAAGHLYGVSDTVKSRRVYPVADIEWYPLGATEKGGRFTLGRIRAIGNLSRRAGRFVNACDLDVEGETIGHNILRYACGGKQTLALRAKFSSLTKEEIVRAFSDGSLGQADGAAAAGRLRHVIDFLWGVNLSRVLSEALRTRHSFRTVSIGRVQGPTLSFAVERELEVRTFLPIPYWTAKGSFRSGSAVFEAKYSTAPTIRTHRAAGEVKRSCEGKDGVVVRVVQRTLRQRPPPPFNLADLQKEAFRQFGLAPSKTLHVAEKLYLGALISYPRTGSQMLPKLDYGRLLSKIAAIPGYSKVSEVLLRGTPRPMEGQGIDPAHPAIYPTGEVARKPLTADEVKVFDLVVERFVACFGEEAVHEVRSAEISVGEHEFRVEGTALLEPGWMRLARGWRPKDDRSRVSFGLHEGDRIALEAVAVEGHVRARPPWYNQATLLEKMEREGIGTKATRADTISTLLERGYVRGDDLVPTEFGLAIVEAMKEHCPQIISTDLTREIEAKLEGVESSGGSGLELFEQTLASLLAQIGELKSHEGEIAVRMRGSISGGAPGMTLLGGCPVCHEGNLWIVHSRKSGKRFVGCTNYSKGCAASAPLPQRGSIRAAPKPCSVCSWPVVHVGHGRRSWRLCVNDRCPRKVNVYTMQNSQKKGKS